jgi:type III pantothenate kinase
MKPDVVADVGNTRIKWGLCRDDCIEEIAALPANDENAWDSRAEQWGLPNDCAWALAGVHPQRQLKLAEWILRRGGTIRVLSSHQDLPIKVAVKEPGRVGLDRLLNAVAARYRVKRSVSCLIVDAGSAVTVDWVDDIGSFQGGAIFPGCRLMAKALHDYTAALPLVDVDRVHPPLPGNSTTEAIQAGVFWAVAGGIKATLRQMTARVHDRHREVRYDPVIFLTGGDSELLAPIMDPEVNVWPEMTLEGIRIAAEALS